MLAEAILLMFVNIISGQNSDRDLSTDILDYVLRRGELNKDDTIASDILGFVKKKIETSDFNEIPPEIGRAHV